jgi:glycosyltransferase involved in cell wall biosynthesis
MRRPSFVPVNELADYFRAADIGVWPRESTSMLDAAACGLPIVVNDTSSLLGIEGNGLVYELNNVDDMVLPCSNFTIQ